MYQRKLLYSRENNLIIHLDSDSIEKELASKNISTLKIINFARVDNINFIRSPLDSKTSLTDITAYTISESTNKIESIEYETESLKTQIAVGYKKADVTEIAKVIFEKDKVLDKEIYEVKKIFIQACFNRFRDENNIYVTENKTILKKRLWFESHFPGGILNIMSLNEVKLFLDLFFKYKDQYYWGSHQSSNKGYWYQLSTLEKNPILTGRLSDSLISSIYNRYSYGLIAIDEMGIQFFQGSNNDTMDNTIYHFNYFLTLTTGIFDNLALIADKLLKINFGNLMGISLKNNKPKDKGKTFLSKIKGKNTKLKNHIDNSRSFINLIHYLRDTIVHREGVKKIRYEMKDSDFKWDYNFIIVDNYVKDRLREMKDKNKKNNSFLTEWGFFADHGEFYLEPYHFSMECFKILSKFINEFLNILGFKIIGLTGELKTSLDFFEKNHLGY